jgi:hypothetical protein
MLPRKKAKDLPDLRKLKCFNTLKSLVFNHFLQFVKNTDTPTVVLEEAAIRALIAFHSLESPNFGPS